MRKLLLILPLLLISILVFASTNSEEALLKVAGMNLDWPELLILVSAILELVLRLIPTGKVYSIISAIKWILDRLIPDLGKDGNGKVKARWKIDEEKKNRKKDE